ncbi:MAG: glycosyltransferase family 4 protein [Candidatus Kariarchaeaceae archaeon]
MLSREYDLTWINSKNTVYCEEIPKAGAKIIKCQWGIHNKYIDIILFYFWLCYWLAFRNRLKYDLVYTFHEQSMIAGYIVKKLLIAKILIVDVLDDPALGYLDSKWKKSLNPFLFFERCVRLVIKKLKRLALTYSDGVITTGIDISDPLPMRLINVWSIPVEKMLCVPNGVDLKITKVDKKNSKNNIFTVFYVGWVAPQRGIDILIAAFKEFIKIMPSAVLLMAGHIENVDKKWLELEIQKYEDKIKYLGPKESEEIWQFISKSHVCVYPFSADYLDYVFPVKIFEYLALGCPVIASDMTVIRRIIKNEENGILVQPRSINDLKDALLKIYKNDNMRLKLMNNAKSSIKEYDWNVINKRIKKFIDKILYIE